MTNNKPNTKALKELKDLLTAQIPQKGEPLSKDPIEGYGRVMFDMSTWFQQVDPKTVTNEGHFCNTAACALGFAAMARIGGLYILDGEIRHPDVMSSGASQTDGALYAAMKAFGLAYGDAFSLFVNNAHPGLPAAAMIRRLDAFIKAHSDADLPVC
jgi:hypothetical protein